MEAFLQTFYCASISLTQDAFISGKLTVLFYANTCLLPFWKLLQNFCFKTISYFFFNFLKFLFIYLWLCWILISVWGLSPAAVSGGHSSSRCAGPSLLQPLPLRSTGSRRAGSAIVAHGPICSAACGSSRTRARTRVPCTGRQTPNHCATREAPKTISFN